ncbi:MAG: hypothetical protein AAB503_02765 [Patescibacteria group bacterium]
MANEALLEKLHGLRTDAEKVAQEIRGIKDELGDKETELNRIIDDYYEEWIELLAEEFRTRGVLWCTSCFAGEFGIFGKLTILPESELQPLFIEGRVERRCGYQGGEYTYDDFAVLYRACPACRDAAFDKHGWRGEYDKQLKTQAYFHTFRVERHDDGFYACEFGNWVKLENKDIGKSDISDLNEEFIKDLAEKWNLPARIEIDKDGKLAIHEQTTVAKAV